MSYNRIYEKIVPATIERQIAAIEREIYTVAELNRRRIAANKLHPSQAAIHMHELRSILVTLRAVRDGHAVPVSSPMPPPAAEVQSA